MDDEKVPETDVQWVFESHPTPPGWIFLAAILVSEGMPGNVRLAINANFPFECMRPDGIDQILGILRIELEYARELRLTPLVRRVVHADFAWLCEECEYVLWVSHTISSRITPCCPKCGEELTDLYSVWH